MEKLFCDTLNLKVHDKTVNAFTTNSAEIDVACQGKPYNNWDMMKAH